MSERRLRHTSTIILCCTLAIWAVYDLEGPAGLLIVGARGPNLATVSQSTRDIVLPGLLDRRSEP